MTGKKRASRSGSLGSNLSKVDAHAVAAAEYKEIPELTEDWFAKATPMIGKRW